jgi:eukaryotic-like serine/threonine-protein kinase
VPVQSEDTWPIPEDSPVLREDTLIGGPPPVAPISPPPDRRIGAGMLLAIATIVVVALGVLAAWLLTHRGSKSTPTTVVLTTTASTAHTAASASRVAVPRLVGLKETEALVRLAQIGLRPKEIFRPTSQPSRTVVSQRPKEAAELRRGGQVTLVVDAGAPKIAVPNLKGMKIGDAQAKLDALGFRSTKTSVISDQPAGTIIDQAPEAGSKLAKGSALTLSVARAAGTQTATTTAASSSSTSSTTAAAGSPQPQNATMPDVQGQTEASAAQAMTQAGVLPSIVFVPSSDPLGTVEAQAKTAGTTVPYHSHVQINVSSGPGQKPQEQVPNVVGQQLQQAVAAMQAAQLRLIYVKLPVTDKAQAGKIAQQSPLGGSHAPQHAQVLVFLAVYRA